MPFNYYALVPIVTAIISTFTGYIILRKNPKNELNVVWSLFLFLIALWTIGEAGIRLSGTGGNSALYWHNIFVVPGGAFVGCVFFHFSLVFPSKHRIRDNKFLLPIIYFAMLLFSIHAFIRGWIWEPDKLNVVADSYTRESLTKMIGREVYEINMVYIAGLVFGGIIILIQNFIKLKGSPQRMQIGIVIFATVFFMGAGFITDVMVPAFGITIMELASVGALATAITVAYVILKLKIIDIELISEKIDTGKLEDWIKNYNLYKGYIYLVPETKVDLSFKLFAREVSRGAHGLLLTSTEPNKVREIYKLRKTPIIWITQESAQTSKYLNDPNVIVAKKGDLTHTMELIEMFLKKSTNNIIFLEDLNQLYNPDEPQSDRQAILNTARSTFDMINEYNSRFIISLHPESLNLQKGQPIVRTKSPILEMRLLTIYIIREVFQQVIDAMAVRVGEDAISKKLHWLKSTDPFFLKVKYKDGRVTFLSQKAIYRSDLIKKIKLFITTMQSLDRSLELDAIALRILMKFGFSEYEYQLQVGYSYIIEDDKGDKTFDIFQKFIDSGFEGLCISKTKPKKLLEKYGLVFNTDNIFWLTDISSDSDRVVPPKLEHIFMEIENFMERVPDKKIIIIDGIEYLISYSGDVFNPVLGFLRKLVDKISEKRIILIIPLNFKALDEQQLSLLQRSGIEIIPENPADNK